MPPRRLALLIGLLSLFLIFAGSAQAIVGGHSVNPNRYPWLATIFLKTSTGHREAYCGGTLVAPDLVLTANHCLDVPKHRLEVRLGQVGSARLSGQWFQMKAIYRDPQLTKNQTGDLALVRLSRPSTITPIRLTVNDRYAVPGRFALVLGHGVTNARNLAAPRQTMGATIKFDPVSECQQAYYHHFVANQLLCAIGAHTDTCYGDSGGPLLVKTPNGLAEIGTTEYGSNYCNDSRSPGVYTRLSANQAWLARWLPITPLPPLAIDPLPPRSATTTIVAVQLQGHPTLVHAWLNHVSIAITCVRQRCRVTLPSSSGAVQHLRIVISTPDGRSAVLRDVIVAPPTPVTAS